MPRTHTARIPTAATRDRRPVVIKSPFPSFLKNVDIPEWTGYIFKAELIQNGTKPEINRILRLPSSTTFHDFHRAILLAFEWPKGVEYLIQLHDVNTLSDYFDDATELLCEYPIRKNEDLPNGTFKSSNHRQLRQVFGHEHKVWKKRNARVIHEQDFGNGDRFEHRVAFLGTDEDNFELLEGINREREVTCLTGQGKARGHSVLGAGAHRRILGFRESDFYMQTPDEHAEHPTGLDFDIIQVNEALCSIRPVRSVAENQKSKRFDELRLRKRKARKNKDQEGVRAVDAEMSEMGIPSPRPPPPGNENLRMREERPLKVAQRPPLPPIVRDLSQQ